MPDRPGKTVHAVLPVRMRPKLSDETLAALHAAAEEGTDLAAALPEGEVAWESPVLMLVDTETDDGRSFATAGFGHRDLPLPLMANNTTTWEHQDAEIVGRIEVVSLDGTTVSASGVFTETPFAREMAAHVALGNITGVSVDVAAFEFEVVFPEVPDEIEEGDEGTVHSDELLVKVNYLRWEIMGATVTPFPAFADARLTIPDPEPLAASAIAGPPWVVTTSPPGPLTVVTAAGGPLRPPRSWFDQPALTGPTPATWTPDGYGFGHFGLKPAVALALGIDPCHTGSPDRCVCLPSTATGYSRFMAPGQVVECDDGSLVNVGAVTLRGGHPRKGTARTEEDAQRHYDDTDSAVAYVTVGDDEWGAWFAGCIRPGITDEQIIALRASSLSGHWQPYPRTGTNELIRICCVNTAGFPIGVAASGFVLPDAVPTVTVEVGEDGEERVVELFAAGHPEVLAAMKADAIRAAVPATAGDLAELAERVEALTSDLAAAKAALSTLDPEVRERVLANLG